MNETEAPIRTPCSADWESMEGDEERRFCTTCNKHVHDLSAMTEDQARAVVARDGVCVRYRCDPDTGDLQHRRPRTFAVRLATAAVLTAGVALPAVAAISREPGEVGLLSMAWEALLDWSSEPEEEAHAMDAQLVLEETEQEMPHAGRRTHSTRRRLVMGGSVLAVLERNSRQSADPSTTVERP